MMLSEHKIKMVGILPTKGYILPGLSSLAYLFKQQAFTARVASTERFILDTLAIPLKLKSKSTITIYCFTIPLSLSWLNTP
jgi:hypothetical protein